MKSPLQAYHGSTHDLDHFSLDRIGTGEGVQAYGWGLYFAEAKEVASSYQIAGESAVMIDGRALSERKRFTKLDPDVRIEVEEILRLSVAADQSAEAVRREIFGMAAHQGGCWRLAYDLIRDAKKVFVRPGHLYRVDLDVEPSEMLDWDAPLSRQPPVVRKALAEVNPVNYRGDEKTGGAAYEEMVKAAREGGAKAVSQRLVAQGVKGVRYLDRQSREAGEGSRNFVIFDDHLVRLVEKDGQAILPCDELFPVSKRDLLAAAGPSEGQSAVMK